MSRHKWCCVAPLFELPLIEAACRLGVSPSSLKVWRRGFGLTKWPYRKIRALRNKISLIRSNEMCCLTADQVKDTIMLIEGEIDYMKMEPCCISPMGSMPVPIEGWKKKLSRMRRNCTIKDQQSYVMPLSRLSECSSGVGCYVWLRVFESCNSIVDVEMGIPPECE